MSEIIITKRTPVVARLGQAARAAYDAFFGPGQPLPQQAPAGSPPRQFDYQPFTNLSYTPRATETVSFDQLRALADSYWLVRTLIETRKDQMTKIPWHFRLKPKVGEGSFESQKRSESDPRVRRLTEFFERPDGTNSWQTWLRMVLEDMLVIDAPAILPWRTRGGDIYKLVPLDGATIKPVLDPMGMTPESGDVAYQQIIRGLIFAQLSTRDLVYMPRNRRTNKIYGFSPVEQLIFMVNLGLRRQLHQLNYYVEGNVPEAVCQVPETWSPDQIKQFQTWFDSALVGNLAARRRVTFVPSLGGKEALQWTKDPKLADEMDEWLARAACFCFSVPPTAFVKQNNRATAQQANETALREGQEPTKNSVRDIMNLLVQHPDYFNEPKVEFAWDDDVAIDKLKQAQVDQIYISIGKTGIDELRERDGQEKIGVGPGVITKMGFIAFKDGEAVMQMAQPGEGEPSGSSPSNEGGKPAAGKKSAAKKPAAKLAKAEAVKKKLLIQTDTLPAKATKRAKTVASGLSRFLKKQGKKIGQAAAEAYSNVHKDDADDIDRILRDLDLDWSSLESSVEGSIADTAKESAADVLTELEITDQDVFDLVNKDAIDFAMKRAAELVGMKFEDGQLIENPDARWAITETTREELRRIVTKAFEDGQTPAELEQTIGDSFQFSDSRAEMIARTEMAAAHVQGSLAAAERSGVAVKKFSMLSADHDHDDECDDNEEAGEIDLDEDFPSGDDGPPFHPNCNCALGIWYESEAAG